MSCYKEAASCPCMAKHVLSIAAYVHKFVARVALLACVGVLQRDAMVRGYKETKQWEKVYEIVGKGVDTLLCGYIRGDGCHHCGVRCGGACSEKGGQVRLVRARRLRLHAPRGRVLWTPMLSHAHSS